MGTKFASAPLGVAERALDSDPLMASVSAAGRIS